MRSKSLHRIDLILGILVGIHAVVIGATGSILVYSDELVEIVRPDWIQPLWAIHLLPDETQAVVQRSSV